VAGVLRRTATTETDTASFHGAESLPVDGESLVGLVALQRCAMQVEDTRGADAPPLARSLAGRLSYRSIASAPLLRDGTVLGVLSVSSPEPGRMSDEQMALLATFADQAVIALENTRLFNETREALERQTAIAEVLRAISASPTDVQPVFDAIAASSNRLLGGHSTMVARVVGDQLHLVAFTSTGEAGDATLASRFPMPTSGPVVGMVLGGGAPVRVHDTEALQGDASALRELARARGFRSMLMVPLMRDVTPTGVINVTRREPGEFDDHEVELLQTFASQAVIAIENVRLFSEIREKSAQLEAANRHKSEFLANMSHELRTPLNAIIGFSEVLTEQMFGEVNDKQMEYLRDIHASGQHLLSLINDVLDLSKIEAGRMELELSRFDLGLLLEHSATLVRERAQRHGLALGLDVGDGLQEWVADARKLKQTVVNLLSNAVKFTPTGGRVTVRARLLPGTMGPAGDRVEVAVADTGVGIAPEDQALVFEEFRQAGGDVLTKSEGTGLGLALVRRFVELHGGSVTLDSAPGRGSTFTFTLPRLEEGGLP
jgi:signal transduction histidine kinase